MANAVFVAPFGLEATLRFVSAAAAVEGVRLGLVTQDPPEALPAALRASIAAHRQVDDALSPARIVEAVRGIESRIGRVSRLVATLEQLQVPLAHARRALGLPGMSPETAEGFRDKDRMKTVLRRAGVPCARHLRAGSAAQAWAFAEEVGGAVVLKPPAGAGARDTARATTRAEVEAFFAGGLRDVLVEEFVSGVEHSLDTASLDGRHLWHSISRYDPTPLHVLENPWIQWCVVLPREIDGPAYDDVREAGRRALDALGMDTGVTHMEWFRRRDGSLAISEVAARPPGAQFCTLVSYAHDVDFYRAWARLVLRDEFDPPPRRYAAGAAYLRGQGRGRVRAVRGLAEVARDLGPLVVEAKVPEVGQAASGTYEGEGYVIVRHPSTEVVERALRRVVETVRVDLG
jgi:biotin carboxylase